MFYLGSIRKKDIWFYFEPRDIWVGVHIKRPEYCGGYSNEGRTDQGTLFNHEVFICFLPMLEVRIQWTEVKKDSNAVAITSPV